MICSSKKRFIFSASLLTIALSLQSCFANESPADFVEFPVPGAPFAYFQNACGYTAEGKHGFDLRQFDLKSVLLDLNHRLSKTWVPDICRTEGPMPLAVDFQIDKDGQISKIAITKSSGVESTDQSLIKALRAISPLAHLKNDAEYLKLTVMFGCRYEEKPKSKQGTILLSPCD